jgi:hypothetical protein
MDALALDPQARLLATAHRGGATSYQVVSMQHLAMAIALPLMHFREKRTFTLEGGRITWRAPPYLTEPAYGGVAKRCHFFTRMRGRSVGESLASLFPQPVMRSKSVTACPVLGPVVRYRNVPYVSRPHAGLARAPQRRY